jgi:hypothetical protein
MVITVEDRPHALLELLWVREAHALRVAGDDLPPLLVDTPAPAGALTEATRAEWERAWPRVWNAAAAHTGRDEAPRLMERLHESAPGSPERLQLLQELTGPTWRDEFGDDVFTDDSYREWEHRGFERHRASIEQRLRDSPEHRDLDELKAAWGRGLTKIVTIPCRGEFHRRVSSTALPTTEAERLDSAAYRRVLNAFA